MTGYLLLLLAILGELLGTNLLKAANGFTVFWPTIGSLLAYGACFYFLSLSLKTLNLSVAYALWAGLGILLTTIVAVLVWKEALSLPNILGIALIVIGVVVLNLSGLKH
ncbi:MAG: multidrug efflux SMR transporter [Lactobacillus sp.]|jgi:small multidrug resistance pump|nr:multidrug efflux SMR transporter [Lactobacillus sp.]MCI2031952.1 multidrug efflux SMR transporter [Lactobacillus sp.]